MSVSRDELRNRIDRFKDACKNASIKLTHQRLEIFREVAARSDHPDADTIFKAVRDKLPTVSLDTVYRTLWMLIDLGMLTTLGNNHERTRFDANIDTHHHFICRVCGKATDFCNGAYDSLEIPQIVDEIGHVEHRQVELKGVCRTCSEDLE